jgi:hypothetical protein
MQWAEANNSPRYASMRRTETVRANAYGRADAVLAVLPTRQRWSTSTIVEGPQTVSHNANERAAVLPAPDSRAAVLLEGAAHLIRLRDSLITHPESTGKFLSGIERAAAELRRLAGEAQQDPAPGGGAGCSLCGHRTCTGKGPCGVVMTSETLTSQPPCSCTGVARSGQPET